MEKHKREGPNCDSQSGSLPAYIPMGSAAHAHLSFTLTPLPFHLPLCFSENKTWHALFTSGERFAQWNPRDFSFQKVEAVAKTVEYSPEGKKWKSQVVGKTDAWTEIEGCLGVRIKQKRAAEEEGDRAPRLY